MSEPRPLDHDQALELSALAAVGTLDERERGELDAHLDGCRPCRREAALLDDTASLLPLVLPPVAPSRDLKTRLLQKVRDFPPLLQQRRFQTT
jgi:anti-sigma factor RsiW